MKDFRILLDMDEVLADFVGFACRIHGTCPTQLARTRTPGHWDITPALSRILGQPLTQDQFWEPIQLAEAEFWTNIEPLPWARELTRLVESYTNDWHVVSAPSRCPTSYDGKVRWLKNYFGPTFDRFILTPHKHVFANPRAILIDDRKSNIDRFTEYGGLGILFPTLGGPLFPLARDPLPYVRQELDRILTTI